MSSESKNLACTNFNEKYKVLNDSKKNNFSRLCNKLLNENFIYFTENNPSDKNDYYAILELKDVIEDYFKLIDFELINVDTYKIFYLKTLADRNRIRLKKFETVILLILRLLYHKGRLNVNLSSDMKTTVLELTQEINKTGIFKNNFNKTDFINALKQLKRYKLIYFNFTDLNDDNVILIYPTILYVVTIEDINLLNEKINKYKALKGDEEDEISED